jgi:putative hydrolase of the HAD superfamily
MPAYKHILFDLDHTLWDFDRCSCETLGELFHEHQLQRLGIGEEEFIDTFKVVNRRLWALYSAGAITQHELRTNRFRTIFKELGIDENVVPEGLAEDYLQLCPLKPHLLPFAREVLNYLKEKYVLHIVTNGFADIQAVKMTSANIGSYFTEIVTSERAGCKKPDRRIFDFTLQQIKARPEHCIMIGDSLDADILGARNASLDHVFYNYEKLVHTEKPMHEINCLSELMHLL